MLYAVSARDPQAPPDFFDALQLLLVVSALAVDALALAAIAGRITEFGFTPNRVAALGENLILLVNLLWSGVALRRSSCAGAGRSRRSNAGKRATCPSTPPGPPSSSSCSRRCLRLPEW